MHPKAVITAVAALTLALAGCAGASTEEATDTATETVTETAVETETEEAPDTEDPLAGLEGEWVQDATGSTVTIAGGEITYPGGYVFAYEEPVEDETGCFTLTPVLDDGSAGVPSAIFCPAGVDASEIGIDDGEVQDQDRLYVAQSAGSDPYLKP